MSARHGGPAFPTTRDMCASLTGEPDYSVRGDDGMTLRDYFAAKAMQVGPVSEVDTTLAERSYAIADAMLAERAK